MFIAMYHTCTNDRNGNPRRGWALRLDGVFVGWVDEGNGGRRNLEGAIKSLDLGEPFELDTSPATLAPADYNDFARVPFEREPVNGRVNLASEAAVPVYGATQFKDANGGPITWSRAKRVLGRGLSVEASVWCPAYQDEEGAVRRGRTRMMICAL